MSVDRLPNFSTSLNYCINAKKNLIYIHKKQSDSNFDTIRQSNIIKNTIDRRYRNDGVNCHIVEELPKDSSSWPDATSSALKIVVIPNVAQCDKDQQVKMVKMIKAAQNEGTINLFVGVIQWDPEEDEKTIIGLRDWLKHRFWIACFAPNEQEILTIGPAKNLSYREVHCGPMIRRYILDVMVHLRMHRFVDITKGGGIPTSALNDVIVLSQLVSIDKFEKKFLTPEHVKVACLWYFPLHIELLKGSAMDTTVLYGSRPQMVDDFLEKLYKLGQSESSKIDNPLFLETLIVQDVLSKIVPPP